MPINKVIAGLLAQGALQLINMLAPALLLFEGFEQAVIVVITGLVMYFWPESIASLRRLKAFKNVA